MELRLASALPAWRARRRNGERVATSRLAGGLAIMALTLSFVAAGPGTVPGDIAVTRFVQGLSDGAVGDIARFMNALGQTPNMFLIGMMTVLICLVRRRPDAALLILGAMLMRFANPILKNVLASPRPSTADGVRVEEIASGFGFPSGHVMGMTLFAGTLAILAWDAVPHRRGRIAVVLGTAAVLFASGWGRIAVGAHWPSDVLGGYLFGGIGVSGLAWSWRLAPRLATWREGVNAWAISPAKGIAAMTSVVPRRWRIGTLLLGGLMAVGIAWAADAAQTTTDPSAQSARIIAGSCADTSVAAAYDLKAVSLSGSDDENDDRDDAPRGDEVGAAGAVPVAASGSTVNVSLDTLLAQPHAFVVTAGAADAPVVACGEIGGQLRGGDELIVGLTPVGDAGSAGIAFLDNDDDSQVVEVTLYLIAWGAGTAGTPAA